MLLAIVMRFMVSWAAASSPIPMSGVYAAVLAERSVEPVQVKLYDENLRVHATLAINPDGSTDAATEKEIRHLFRCRMTGRERHIAQHTLAMLADVAQKYEGKTIEFVSVYRLGGGESPSSPHRDGRAIDFRIRGVNLGEIRDYLWKKYSDVGIGWYPSEQFLHMDTRPGLHDTAWTFLNGVNRYHPWWSEKARLPVAPPVVKHPHAPAA